MTKEGLLLKAFYEYSIFFENENKISLLDKRDFKLIYSFKIIFEHIFDKNIDVKTLSKMLFIVRKQRNSYFKYLKDTFTSDIVTYEKSYLIFDYYQNNADQRDEILNIFNKSIENLSNFFSAYSLLSRYKSITYIEELLIEFNNFLSHITQAIINQKSYELNVQRANAHLHRATLDAFKVIIHDLRMTIRYDEKLTKDFLSIRYLELDLIGDLESGDTSKSIKKNNIQSKYYHLTKKLLV